MEADAAAHRHRGELETEVAIVGGGVMGLAAAHALTAPGAGVVLLERFRIGHTHGSSHGTSRIFRLVYADPCYVALAQAALPLWRELETETGEQLLTTTGSLDVGSDLEPFAHALADAGVAHELLDARELRRAVPALHPAPGDDCLFQPDGGIVHADRTVRALHDAVAGRRLDPRGRRASTSSSRSTSTSSCAATGWRSTPRRRSSRPAPGPRRSSHRPASSLELRPTRETVVYVDCDGRRVAADRDRPRRGRRDAGAAAALGRGLRRCPPRASG